MLCVCMRCGFCVGAYLRVSLALVRVCLRVVFILCCVSVSRVSAFVVWPCVLRYCVSVCVLSSLFINAFVYALCVFVCTLWLYVLFCVPHPCVTCLSCVCAHVLVR